jgi:hypothetical protein
MKRTAIASIVAIAALAAGQGLAQGAPGGPHASCAADMAKLCAHIQDGSSQMRQCFMAHRDQISSGCKNAIIYAMMHGQPMQPTAPHN